MSPRILFIRENVSEIFVGKTKTRTVCSLICYPENHAVYDIMWQNLVERGRATVDNMVETKCYKHTLSVCCTF